MGLTHATLLYSLPTTFNNRPRRTGFRRRRKIASLDGQRNCPPGTQFLPRSNGTNNLNFAFVADVSAVITLTQPSPGIVDINGTITLKPNATYWVCAIAGLFFLIPWAVNFLYWIMDPRTNYQIALDRVELPGDPTAPPLAEYVPRMPT
jgi:hypothetical protein